MDDKHPQGGNIRFAVSVNLMSQAAKIMMQLLSTIVLARLLFPEDFGLFATALIFFNLFQVVRDLGTSQAIIYIRELTQEKASSVFWLSTALTGSLSGVFALSGWLSSEIFDEERLVALSLTLAISLFISGLALIHRALLLRRNKMLEIALAENMALALSIASGVWLALEGHGYWSLAIMHIVNAIIATGLIWMFSKWYPALELRFSESLEMLRISANVGASNALNYLSRNTDDFLIGKFLGIEALGFYSRAYRLVMFPLTSLNAPLANALLPTLSRQSHDEQLLQKTFLGLVFWINLTTTPLLLVLVLYGDHLITVLLGDKWQPAGLIFSILAFAALFQPLGNLSGLLLTALGQTDRMLRWSLISSAWLILSFLIGINFGLTGIVISYAIATKIQQPVLLWYSLRKSPITISEYLRNLTPGLFLALVVLMIWTVT